jgi:hypothetical protein
MGNTTPSPPRPSRRTALQSAELVAGASGWKHFRYCYANDSPYRGWLEPQHGCHNVVGQVQVPDGFTERPLQHTHPSAKPDQVFVHEADALRIVPGTLYFCSSGEKMTPEEEMEIEKSKQPWIKSTPAVFKRGVLLSPAQTQQILSGYTSEQQREQDVVVCAYRHPARLTGFYHQGHKHLWKVADVKTRQADLDAWQQVDLTFWKSKDSALQLPSQIPEVFSGYDMTIFNEQNICYG